MAITKVTSGLISADASSIDLNIDAGTLYLDVSENRVGIGTTSPSTPLQVGDFGDTARAATFHGGSILLDGGAASEIIIGDGNVAYMSIQTTDNATAMNIRNFSGSSDLVTIERTSGNVGIGTTSPDSMLHLSAGSTGVSGGGSAAITMTNKFDNPDNSWIIAPVRTGVSNTGLEIRDVTDSRTDMVFDGSGNVGIGASSPVTFGAGTIGLTINGSTSHITWQNNGTNAAFAYNSGNNFIIGSEQAGSSTIFTAAGSQHMRIDSSGNLLVGTTSADAKMVVKGSGTGTAYTFRTSDSSGNFRLAVRDDGLLNTGTGSSSPYNLTTGSAANMHVLSNGTIYRSTSSLRYKNTVTDASHGLTELLTLRPVTYKGNNDGDTIFGGLIAEEVHDAGLTEFVQYNDENQPDALAYGNMVSLCIKAIQEQQTIIDDLKTRIETLENA